MRIPSGSTDRYIYFVAVDSTDLKTRETGLTTFTVYRSRNGGAAAAMTTPTVNETDMANMPGVYELLLDEDTTLTAGNDTEEMILHITQADMAPVDRVVELYRPETTEGNTLGVAADGDVSGNVDGSVGSVTGAVGSVTGDVGGDLQGDVVGEVQTGIPTAIAIADQVWDEALSGHVAAGSYGKAVADIETDATAILADTNELQTDDVPGLIAALNDISTADVNTQVADVMKTDTLAELAAVPAATSSMEDRIAWLFALARNKITQTATTSTLRDDADGADVATSTVSDDGTTYTRGEWT